jgi:hypothetical protein
MKEAALEVVVVLLVVVVGLPRLSTDGAGACLQRLVVVVVAVMVGLLLGWSSCRQWGVGVWEAMGQLLVVVRGAQEKC